jgi:hypothetical protein
MEQAKISALNEARYFGYIKAAMDQGFSEQDAVNFASQKIANDNPEQHMPEAHGFMHKMRSMGNEAWSSIKSAPGRAWSGIKSAPGHAWGGIKAHPRIAGGAAGAAALAGAGYGAYHHFNHPHASHEMTAPAMEHPMEHPMEHSMEQAKMSALNEARYYGFVKAAMDKGYSQQDAIKFANDVAQEAAQAATQGGYFDWLKNRIPTVSGVYNKGIEHLNAVPDQISRRLGLDVDAAPPGQLMSVAKGLALRHGGKAAIGAGALGLAGAGYHMYRRHMHHQQHPGESDLLPEDHNELSQYLQSRGPFTMGQDPMQQAMAAQQVAQTPQM